MKNLVIKNGKIYKECTWVESPYYLYILSNDNLLQGDFAYDPKTHNIFIVGNEKETSERFLKVIATTDSNLIIECQGCRFHRNNASVIYTCGCENLLRIPNNFIENYKNMTTNKILVEYDNDELKYTSDGKIIIDEINNEITDNVVMNMFNLLKSGEIDTFTVKRDESSKNKYEIYEGNKYVGRFLID